MRAIAGAIAVAVALTTPACGQSDRASSNDAPEISLYTQPGAADATRLDLDLRTFGRVHDLRLTATHFPTSPTNETVYRLFGEGYEIMVREPFNEGEYRAIFYSSGGKGTGRDPLALVSADFQKEVLGPAVWTERRRE